MSIATFTQHAHKAAQLRWTILQTLEVSGVIGAFLEVILATVRVAHPDVSLEDVTLEIAFLCGTGLVKTDLGGGRCAAMLTRAGRNFVAYKSSDIESIERPRVCASQ
jgi:hypothetical protein